MSTINSNPYLVSTPPKGAEKKQTINSVPYLIQFEEGSGIGFEARIVDELPEVGENGVMYLIPNGGATGNTYDEYLWIQDTQKFEKVGTTEVIPPEVVQETGQSMTAVMSQKAVTDELEEKQDELTAGENITIENNVISAEGGVKVLTSADYNYPENNPNRVALWLLEPGFYIKGVGVWTIADKNESIPDFDIAYKAFIITRSNSSYPKETDIVAFASGNLSTALSSMMLHAYIYGDGLLRTVDLIRDLKNNLTTTEADHPLDARQGKVLKDLIDARVPAPTAGDAGKFLKGDGTWGEVSGGGGIIIGGTTAPTEDTVGEVGSLYSYYDETNDMAVISMCTHVTAQGTTPETYKYTWTRPTVATINDYVESI